MFLVAVFTSDSFVLYDGPPELVALFDGPQGLDADIQVSVQGPKDNAGLASSNFVTGVRCCTALEHVGGSNVALPRQPAAAWA